MGSKHTVQSDTAVCVCASQGLVRANISLFAAFGMKLHNENSSFLGGENADRNIAKILTTLPACVLACWLY